VVSTFYCEVVANDTWEFPIGVYSIPDKRQYATKISRCYSFSANVWVQGPKGKVRLLKHHGKLYAGKYITNKDSLLKEFMWAKLRSNPLKNYI
jgi:hypothetical protein